MNLLILVIEAADYQGRLAIARHPASSARARQWAANAALHADAQHARSERA